MKILVLRSYCLTTLDDFVNGENPNTTEQYDFDHLFNGIHDSFEELCDNVDLPKDPSYWTAYDPGRMICSRMEDTVGNEVLPEDKDFELWKEGKKKLYAVEYNFFIQFIKEIYTPSMEEIAKTFNMKEY